MMTSGGEKMKEPGKGTTTSANCKTPTRETTKEMMEPHTNIHSQSECNRAKLQRERKRDNQSKQSKRRAARPRSAVATTKSTRESNQSVTGKPKRNGAQTTEEATTTEHAITRKTSGYLRGEEGKECAKKKGCSCENRPLRPYVLDACDDFRGGCLRYYTRLSARFTAHTRTSRGESKSTLDVWGRRGSDFLAAFHLRPACSHRNDRLLRLCGLRWCVRCVCTCARALHSR